MLIAESAIMSESAISCLQRVKLEHPSLNVILIVSPTIKKEEAMQIIRDRLVEGVLVQFLSTEVLWSHIDKIFTVSPSRDVRGSSVFLYQIPERHANRLGRYDSYKLSFTGPD